MSVKYSRCTRVKPSPSTWHWSASSACSCFSTPSLTNPGSVPSSCATSESTSSTVMTSCSPPLLVTVQVSSCTSNEHGGVIHISGL